MYGQETVSRVRSFQQSKGLLVDGVVGPETRSALGI
ncbi:peptidoglycan-binding domain-containing protein [Nostoc sp. NMS4]